MQGKNIPRSALAIAGIAAMAIFMGAGCQKSATQTGTPSTDNTTANSSGDNSNYDTTASPAEIYSKAVDVDVADATDRALADQIKALLATVFGNVKTSGYISNFLSNGSLSLDYTLARPSTNEDVRKLTDVLKQKNYQVDQTTVYETTAVVIASNKTGQTSFSFALGEQKITALYTPVESETPPTNN